MSEPSFPFGGQTPAGRPVEEPPASPEPTPDRRRKLLIGVGAGVGAAVVAVVGFMLVSGGGGGATTASGPVPKGHVVTSSATPTATATLPQTFDGAIGVDPFAPLVVPVAATSGAPAASSAPSPTVTIGAPSPTPSTVLVPVPGPTVTVTATATTTASSSTQQTIQVVSVAPDNSSAAIVVNGKGYNVTPGQQFTPTLKLLTLTNGTTATIQYGDATITLSAGQSTTVG